MSRSAGNLPLAERLPGGSAPETVNGTATGSPRRRLRWASNSEAFRRVVRGSIPELGDGEVGAVDILPSRAGPPTLKYKSEFLHSPFHPVLEAKGLVQTAVDTGAELVLVVGLGLGYHVRELLDRTSAKVILYEPDRALLADLMGRIDYGSLFVPDRLVLVHDEPHFNKAMDASLRIGLRVSWLILPGYAKSFTDRVARIQGRAACRLSLFRRQVEIPATESRRILLRSLENLPWLWKGRGVQPRPDRQVWLNAVVLNSGCAGRLPADLMGAIEARTVVAATGPYENSFRRPWSGAEGTATSGTASGIQPRLRFGADARSPRDPALAVLPLDADPLAFKDSPERPVVYARAQDDLGAWMERVVSGDSTALHLPLGLSAPVDAAVLCGAWFDRTFWVDLDPADASDPSAYDRLADRRFLLEMGAGYRQGGGFKVVLSDVAGGETGGSVRMTLDELRSEVAALPRDSAWNGGDLSGNFLADAPVDRESLCRLYDSLVEERTALHSFSARMGDLFERWGEIGRRPADGDAASILEERRLRIGSFVSDVADRAAPSRLISAVAKPLVRRVLRPWRESTSGSEQLARHLESGQAFLVNLVGDIPLMGRLVEHALFELQQSMRSSRA
ncbi:MAG: hypothetical protein HYT87_00895 [Nitrospirae bacterium]|nr:hypothetical protein [Nitrospirota bacterium]